MPLLIGLAGALGMAFCQWLIYGYAPTEATMGLAQKIFYIHLPLAWWGLISFLLVFISSIAWIARRNDSWDRLAGSAAEIGVLFCGLALLTGSLWARRSWGVWWTWDPRLTTTLVMWFVYAGYLALRGMEIGETRKKLLCAVVGIVAFLDVPLVFVSARLWRSIHPAVFASREGGLPFEMKLCAICCVAAMGLVWWAMLLLRKRQLDLEAGLDDYILENKWT